MGRVGSLLGQINRAPAQACLPPKNPDAATTLEQRRLAINLHLGIASPVPSRLCDSASRPIETATPDTTPREENQANISGPDRSISISIFISRLRSHLHSHFRSAATCNLNLESELWTSTHCFIASFIHSLNPARVAPLRLHVCTFVHLHICTSARRTTIVPAS